MKTKVIRERRSNAPYPTKLCTGCSSLLWIVYFFAELLVAIYL